MGRLALKFWWLVHKDLVSECRARQVWPVMLVLGAVVAMLFAIQMDLPATQRHSVVCGILWLAIFLSGSVALDRSFVCEQEDGCLVGLMSYSIPAGLVYFAKLTVNFVALSCLECVLIPLFVILCDVPLLKHPGALVLAVTLGNVGIAAVGTLLSAVTAGTRLHSNLLVLLVLPLTLPVLLAATEATRLVMASDFGFEWLRWIQLLGAFAVVFATAGIALFEFVIRE
jgi:heme exporter protein B